MGIFMHWPIGIIYVAKRECELSCKKIEAYVERRRMVQSRRKRISYGKVHRYLE